MSIGDCAKAFYGAECWAESCDLSAAQQFVTEFERGNWRVSIDGRISGDYGRFQVLVDQIVYVNATLGFVVGGDLDIRGDRLVVLVSLASEFLDASLSEVADDFVSSFPDASELDAYLYGLETCHSMADIVEDLVDSATEYQNTNRSSEIIKQILDSYSHEAVEAAVALAGVALTMRSIKANLFDDSLRATFAVGNLIGRISGWVGGTSYALTLKGRKSAEVLHDKKGGSRDKAKQIREIWASGRFSSRDECAEQECAAIGMAFGTARRHLRGTPDPNPWPAMRRDK